MVTTLRFEDILEGAFNFKSQKATVLNLLEENDLDDYVSRVVPKSTDDNGKVANKKNQDKAKRILFDSVKDHLIPLISQLKTAKEVYDALTGLFENKEPQLEESFEE